MNLRRAGAAVATPLGWRLVLVGTAAILAAAQFAAPGELPAPVPTPAARAPAPSPHQPAARAAGADYPAIAAHPLFARSRRPWTAPAKPPKPTAKAPAALAKYTVMGVILGGGTRTAFLKWRRGDKTVILSEGQALDGWTLRRIGRAGLHFVSGSDTYDLPLPTPRWPPH